MRAEELIAAAAEPHLKVGRAGGRRGVPAEGVWGGRRIGRSRGEPPLPYLPTRTHRRAQKLAPQLRAVRAAGADSAGELLRHIYKHHPPPKDRKGNKHGLAEQPTNQATQVRWGGRRCPVGQGGVLGAQGLAPLVGASARMAGECRCAKACLRAHMAACPAPPTAQPAGQEAAQGGHRALPSRQGEGSAGAAAARV